MLPNPRPDVIYKSVPDGAVLFDTRQEVYFGLNSVGARIWELLPPRCRTWDDLLLALQEEYPEAEVSMLREDAAELLDELGAQGLLLPSAEDQNAVAQARPA